MRAGLRPPLAALTLATLTVALCASRADAGHAYWLDDWTTEVYQPSAGWMYHSLPERLDPYSYSQGNINLNGVIETDWSYVNRDYFPDDSEYIPEDYAVIAGLTASRRFQVDSSTPFEMALYTAARARTGYRPRTMGSVTLSVDIYNISNFEYIGGVFLSSTSFDADMWREFGDADVSELTMGAGIYQVDVQMFASSETYSNVLQSRPIYPNPETGFNFIVIFDHIDLVPIPEPSSLVMSAIGLGTLGAGMAWQRRGRRRGRSSISRNHAARSAA